MNGYALNVWTYVTCSKISRLVLTKSVVAKLATTFDGHIIAGYRM